MAARQTKSKKQDRNSTDTAKHEPTKVDKPAVGAPIEHYRGEPTDRGSTGDPGSLDEETLDAAAPYNRTYGRK